MSDSPTSHQDAATLGRELTNAELTAKVLELEKNLQSLVQRIDQMQREAFQGAAVRRAMMS